METPYGITNFQQSEKIYFQDIVEIFQKYMYGVYLNWKFELKILGCLCIFY